MTRKPPVIWQPAPGPVARWLPVIFPLPEQPALDLVILSQELVGVLGHWNGARFTPCLGPRQGDEHVPEFHCSFCRDGAPRRWRGYLGALLARQGRQAIVELTQRAVQDCPVIIAQRNDLRGRRLRVRRLGKSRQGRVVAELLGTDRLADNQLPPPPAVEASLMALWFGGNRS